MLGSFKCQDSQALYEGRRVARFVNIERVALRKLRQLDIASRLDDLRVPPQNRLESFKGDRRGHSTASGSTINGVCALCGVMGAR